MPPKGYRGKEGKGKATSTNPVRAALNRGGLKQYPNRKS